uniref:Uncharacterized protein n=1 Tax=Anguilla anguilla TaxID=7936 RepID=A0A0E9UHH0_ANGAN
MLGKKGSTDILVVGACRSPWVPARLLITIPFTEVKYLAYGIREGGDRKV